MNVIEAIETLKRRNQNFVNKNGVSDYSKESDSIINALINFYNETIDIQDNLKAENEKLTVLCKLFGVKLDEFEDKDTEILDYVDLVLSIDNNKPHTNLHLSTILVKYHCILSVIDDIIQASDSLDFSRANNLPQIEENTLTCFPQLKKIENPNYETIKTALLNGEIKP